MRQKSRKRKQDLEKMAESDDDDQIPAHASKQTRLRSDTQKRNDRAQLLEDVENDSQPEQKVGSAAD